MAFPFLAAAQVGLGVAQSLFGNKGGGMPSFPSFGELADQAQQYAPKFTQQNINLQNRVTPGSSQQRQLALNQINSYISGQVPQDVQQNTQRAIAQSFGGGYNPFTGGGQAPSAFARNIGQTSVGLSQFGLSAAPTWQQLANSMVASPASLLSSVMGAAENQYQSQANQYLTRQTQQQYGNTMLNQGLGNFANTLSSQDKSGYLSTISKFGGLPSATSASSYMSSLGYNPSAMSAVPNAGLGTQYPFGQ
jgi:hypothetical protein